MNLADIMVGHLTGGMGHVNIVLSTLMGGLSGSSIADAAMDSKMLVPEMERLGYSRPYSCAVTAASSCITPIIPPGIVLILYSSASNQSVAKMFYAGYVPGLCIMAVLMGINHLISKKRRYKPSRERKATVKDFFFSLKDSIFALFVPFGIIMGLRFGMFTPTEAGAIAIVYATIIGIFFYKELKTKHIIPILIESVMGTAGIMFILAGAQVFSSYLTWERIPMIISETIIQSISSPIVFLIIVDLLLLVIGCFFDGGSAMILLAPLLCPAAAAMKINLIHFGILMSINLTIAGITPPFGSQMFTTCAITNCKMEDYTKEAIPFILAMVVLLFVLSFVPQIILFVPNLLSS
jgi:tripartite ATP-independent transporter DctM subunit